MSLGGILFFAGSVILSTTFSGGWTQLVIGRLILGFGVGLATMATPLYMAELTPPQWRGECAFQPDSRWYGSDWNSETKKLMASPSPGFRVGPATLCPGGCIG
jgi:hypothetical protein